MVNLKQMDKYYKLNGKTYLFAQHGDKMIVEDDTQYSIQLADMDIDAAILAGAEEMESEDFFNYTDNMMGWLQSAVGSHPPRKP